MNRTLCFATLLLVACNGTDGTSGQGSIEATGTYAGTELVLNHAISGVDGFGEFVVILTKNAQCADVDVGPVKNDQNVLIALYSIDMGSIALPTAPGVFPLMGSAGPTADTQVESLDASCNELAAGEYTAGSVTLTSFDGATAAGSFSLTSGSDTLSGTFSSESCDAIANLGAGSGSAGSGETCH